MKKLLTAALFTAMATGAQAGDPVTLQLKWVTQGQFAGYYVAAAKGYYTEEGLDVTILPGGPDVAPTQVLAGAVQMWWWTGCHRLWPRAKKACPWSISRSLSNPRGWS